jgi:hypothetical protein
MCNMEINIREGNRGHIVEIWLKNAEKQYETIQTELKKIYVNFPKHKIVIFESGTKDLVTSTTNLIMKNRTLM